VTIQLCQRLVTPKTQREKDGEREKDAVQTIRMHYLPGQNIKAIYSV